MAAASAVSQSGAFASENEKAWVVYMSAAFGGIAVFAAMMLILSIFGVVTSSGAQRRADEAVTAALAKVCFHQFKNTIKTNYEGEKIQRAIARTQPALRRAAFEGYIFDAGVDYYTYGVKTEGDWVTPCMAEFMAINFSPPDPRGVH